MIEVLPSHPTPTTSVSLRFVVSGCEAEVRISRSEQDIHIRQSMACTCFATPPGGLETFGLGTLPPGDYTITHELYEESQFERECGSTLVSTAHQQFSVAPWQEALPIPVSGPLMFGVGCVAVALIACWRSRSHGRLRVQPDR